LAKTPSSREAILTSRALIEDGLPFSASKNGGGRRSGSTG
jgi:hypothetical protein